MSDPRLNTLLDELRRTRRARKLRGGAVLACALALLIVTPVALLNTGTSTIPTTPPAPQIVNNSPDPAPERIDAPVPRPRIIAVSHQTTPSRVKRIDDDELLDTLNASGRRTGLIRTGNEVFLDADWLTQAGDEPDDDQSGTVPTNPKA